MNRNQAAHKQPIYLVSGNPNSNLKKNNKNAALASGNQSPREHKSKIINSSVVSRILAGGSNASASFENNNERAHRLQAATVNRSSKVKRIALNNLEAA